VIAAKTKTTDAFWDAQIGALSVPAAISMKRLSTAGRDLLVTLK